MRLRNFLMVSTTIGLASALSMLGGIGLEVMASRLLPLIPLVVALPGLNDMVGDYATIIAAHTGDPAERRRSHRQLAIAIMRIVTFNIVALALLSLIIGYLRGYAATPLFALKFVAFVAGSLLVVIGVMFWLNRVLDKILQKTRYNPDDLLIPIATSVADVLMLGLVASAALWLF